LTAGIEIHGRAALSICESLLLCLSDRKILTEAEVVSILRDAADAHAKDNGESDDLKIQKAISDLINAIIDGGNSVRRH